MSWATPPGAVNVSDHILESEAIMDKQTAVYIRVSTVQQSTRSQRADLERWVAAQELNGNVVWYEDKASGKSMDRPAWRKLEEQIARGSVAKVVTWKLDRLGRTASGLTKLFDEFTRRGVEFVCLNPPIDLAQPEGRFMADILAAVAAFETELRAERVRSGQQAARARGVRWGGSSKGRLVKLNRQQVEAIVRMKQEGQRPSNIAAATGVHRATVHRILRRVAEGHIAV